MKGYARRVRHKYPIRQATLHTCAGKEMEFKV